MIWIGIVLFVDVLFFYLIDHVVLISFYLLLFLLSDHLVVILTGEKNKKKKVKRVGLVRMETYPCRSSLNSAVGLFLEFRWGFVLLFLTSLQLHKAVKEKIVGKCGIKKEE